MQVYVSKGGQRYGPYAVEQLRQYVEAGNFVPTDHACCDGANWVTIADVPGFAPAAGKTVEKSRRKLCLIIGVAALLVVALSVGLYFALSGGETPAEQPQEAAKEPPEAAPAPDLFDLTPEGRGSDWFPKISYH